MKGKDRDEPSSRALDQAATYGRRFRGTRCPLHPSASAAEAAAAIDVGLPEAGRDPAAVLEDLIRGARRPGGSAAGLGVGHFGADCCHLGHWSGYGAATAGAFSPVGPAAGEAAPMGRAAQSAAQYRARKAVLGPVGRAGQGGRGAGALTDPSRLGERLGPPVAASVVWRLLARHGWRKVAPNRRHPKSDLAAQQAWKKLPQTLAAVLNQSRCTGARCGPCSKTKRGSAAWRVPGAVGRRCPGDRSCSTAMNANSCMPTVRSVRCRASSTG